MFQFESYPIYVVYSLNRQKAVDPHWNEYSRNMVNARKSAFEGLKQLDFGRFARQTSVANQNEKMIYATWDWQLIEDLDTKFAAEIRTYEQKVRQFLTNIAATRVGKILLKSMKMGPVNEKVWIFPANWDGKTAKTLRFSELEGGGIRIPFNPTAWGREAEATLMHELVHAKRYLFNQFDSQEFPNSNDVNSEFRSSSEEFLATQIENIHVSSRKLSNKFSSYYGPDRDKRAMYKFFSENVEIPVALKYFIEKDPMVKEMAGLRNPDYNPFRDLEQIRKAAGISPHLMRSSWR